MDQMQDCIAENWPGMGSVGKSAAPVAADNLAAEGCVGNAVAVAGYADVRLSSHGEYAAGPAASHAVAEVVVVGAGSATLVAVVAEAEAGAGQAVDVIVVENALVHGLAARSVPRELHGLQDHHACSCRRELQGTVVRLRTGFDEVRLMHPGRLL